MKRILGAVLALILVLALTMSACAATYVTMKKNAAVHSEPADYYTTLGYVPNGTTVKVTKVTGYEGDTWYRLQSGSYAGAYIKASAAKVKSVTIKVTFTTSVYLTANKDVKVGTVYANETYTATAAKNGCYLIKRGSNTAWIPSDKCYIVGSTPTKVTPKSLGKVRITKATLVYENNGGTGKSAGPVKVGQVYDALAVSDSGWVCITNGSSAGWIKKSSCEQKK